MYQINAEDIEYAAYESDDFDPDTIRWDYSGRGMYGETCFSIVGEMRDLGAFMATVVPHIDHEIVPISAWADVRQDSMGLQSVFYWTKIKAVKPQD